MRTVALSAANGRPTRGAPRMWAIRITSLVGGLGVERGPVDVPNFAFHVQNFQMRAIKMTE